MLDLWPWAKLLKIAQNCLTFLVPKSLSAQWRWDLLTALNSTTLSEKWCLTLHTTSLHLQKVPLKAAVNIDNYREQPWEASWPSWIVYQFTEKEKKEYSPIFFPSAIKLPCSLPVCPEKTDIQKAIGGKDCISCPSC